MGDQLSTIKQTSPMLAGLLRRFKLDTPEIIRAYLFALENGGMQELDFVRHENQSFNPRPARIAAILIKDAHVRDSQVIADAILACVSDTAGDALTADADGAMSICNASPADIANQPLIITATLWLDRVRHFHLAKTIPENASDITKVLYKRLMDIQNPLAPLLGKYTS